MGAGGRAQTSVDFAIAMGVFLVALTTVVAFMPTMTQPFAGGQENPLKADRLVAQLVDGQLGHPDTPSHLDTVCTMFFFNETAGDPCDSFEADDDVATKLGTDDDETFVNVTVRRVFAGNADPQTVCATDGTDAAESLNQPSSGCSAGEIRMAVGPKPPSASGSITRARRMAVLNGQRVYVVVRLWT